MNNTIDFANSDIWQRIVEHYWTEIQPSNVNIWVWLEQEYTATRKSALTVQFSNPELMTVFMLRWA